MAYKSETVPLRHWVQFTMMTPRLTASFNACKISGRLFGAFPAPKVSRTIPRIGSCRNARTVASAIPGKRRSARTFCSSVRCVLNAASSVGLRISFHSTSMLTPTRASGLRFRESKASKSMAFSLVVRFPRKRRLLK